MQTIYFRCATCGNLEQRSVVSEESENNESCEKCGRYTLEKLEIEEN